MLVPAIIGILASGKGAGFPNPDAGFAARDYGSTGTIANRVSIPQLAGTSVLWRTEQWLSFAPLIVADNTTFAEKVFRVTSSGGTFARSVAAYNGITGLGTSGVTMVTRVRPVAYGIVTIMSYSGGGTLSSNEGLQQSGTGELRDSVGNTFPGTSFGNWYTIVSRKPAGASTWSHYCAETNASIVGGGTISDPNIVQVHFPNSGDADHCGIVIWYNTTITNAQAVAAADFYFGNP